MADQESLRRLTGIAERLINDISSYRDEIILLKQQIQDLKDKGTDEHDVRKRVFFYPCFIMLSYNNHQIKYFYITGRMP